MGKIEKKRGNVDSVYRRMIKVLEGIDAVRMGEGHLIELRLKITSYNHVYY
jgi:hypothetical protein